MRTKRLLLLIPCVVIAFLIQSYFWVPTYEEQTRGNPERLKEFITASLGDASILNPVLSADSASSRIEDQIFEGLLDRDEDLKLRGRVAKSWEIFEEVYFWVNPRYGSGQAICERLKRAKGLVWQYGPQVQTFLKSIKHIALQGPGQRVVKDSVSGKEVALRLDVPQRVKLTLNKIDPDLKKHLQVLLGVDYFRDLTPLSRISPSFPLPGGLPLAKAMALLPVVEHNPVIIFHLRSGVVFHDQHPVTAADVKFTFQAIMDPRNLSPRMADFEPVKAVEVIDPLTVRVVYKRLYSPALATWSIGLLPAHLLNKRALSREAMAQGRDPDKFTLRDSSFNTHPIGCGPFSFKEWKSDQYIVLTRNENYFAGPPNYQRYVMRVIPDLLTQEMEFYSGTLDTYTLQPHQVVRLQHDPRFQSFSGTSYGYTYIGYNMRRKPFNDVRVRRALSMAVDVDKIIKYVLYGQGERITGPFVKQTDYYDQGIAPVPYDPQRALALLKEAGWVRNKDGWLVKDGQRLQFTLLTNNGNAIRKAILAIVQNQWRRIGVDVKTDTLEWSVFIQERINKLDFDAVILGWVMGIEPDLFQIWHSSQTDPYELNFCGFKNKKADQLIIRIRQEYDHRKQVELCHRLHRIIAQEQPYTFLYVSKWTAVLDKRIVIKEQGPGGEPRFRRIRPTRTGNFYFDFNKWIKLSRLPQLSPGD